MPYLFIDDEPVAGGDELDDMAAEGYLKELMSQKGRTSKKAATTVGWYQVGLCLTHHCLKGVRLQMVNEIN